MEAFAAKAALIGCVLPIPELKFCLAISVGDLSRDKLPSLALNIWV
jgi:hypothetical protein